MEGEGNAEIVVGWFDEGGGGGLDGIIGGTWTFRHPNTQDSFSLSVSLSLSPLILQTPHIDSTDLLGLRQSVLFVRWSVGRDNRARPVRQASEAVTEAHSWCRSRQKLERDKCRGYML